jgi:subtilisin family serine protease
MALNTKTRNCLKAFTYLAMSAFLVSPVSAKNARAKVGKTTVLKRKSQTKTTLKKQPKPVLAGLFTSPFISWGIHGIRKNSTVNVGDAWKNYKKKKEIVVAVVDTGIDPNHPFLKDNLYVANSKASVKNYGIDFAKSRKDKKQPFDTHGHGTHVSGIIKSVLPNVKIMALKYYNPTASGQDNLRSTIAALKYAVDHNVDIINYSGGGPEASIEELSILKRAEQKGILVVAAAGNEESNIDQRSNAYYPASYGLSNIITVTAHDESLKTLNSSNWGKKSVDISAPGHRIRSALPKKRAGYLTGTSQATAFVSGAAALLMSQYPQLKAKDIKRIIKNSARKEKTLTGKCASGGRLDVTKASNLARQMVNGTTLRAVAARNFKKAN